MVAAMPERPVSERPIIIGGCHRSGTSLMRRILDSHSRVQCGPEVKFFADLYVPTWALSFLYTVRSLVDTDEALEVLGAAFVELHERAARAAGKPRWADKAPENAIYWPQWERLLGSEWAFVHVVRNPLDTIASLVEAAFVNVPNDPVGRIQHYRAYVESGLRFEEEHPDRAHRIVYEQLVAEPEVTLEALMRFLAERLEPAQLSFNEQAHRGGVEDRKVLGTTAVHRESVHRWRSVVAIDEAEMIWELTGDLWGRIDPAGVFVEPPASSLSRSD
jgi:hypothetical protein